MDKVRMVCKSRFRKKSIIDESTRKVRSRTLGF